MRLVLVCMAAGLSVSVLVACTTFSADDAPPTTGPDGSPDGSPDALVEADAAGTDAGGGDSALPCPDAACGVLVAAGQLHAREIAVDGELLAWTIDGDVRAKARNGSGSVLAIAQNEPSPPKSLQFLEGNIYYAAGTAVRAARIGGGPPADGFQGSGEVSAVRRFDNVLFFAQGVSFERCTITPPALGCGAAPPELIVLKTPALGLQVAPAGDLVWLYTATNIMGLSATSSAAAKTWPASGVTALAVDEASVYFVQKDAILANGTEAAYAPATLATLAGTPWALDLGLQNVFFTLPDRGTLNKVSKKGGAVTVLAAGLPRPTALAVQGAQVFVILGDGRIVSLPSGD